MNNSIPKTGRSASNGANGAQPDTTQQHANSVASLGAKAVQPPPLWQPTDNERALLALILNHEGAALRVFATRESLPFSDPIAQHIVDGARDCAANKGENEFTAEFFARYCEIKRPFSPSDEEAKEWAKCAKIVRAELATMPTGTRDAIKDAEELARQLATPFEFSTDDDLDAQLGKIEWQWERFIPRGFLTCLVAEQDAGKSTVAQDFCRTVINGGRWPDGQLCAPYAGKLLWIDTDGNLAIFHQRLKDWKMPRGRFIFPPDSLQELAIDNPTNWRWIEAAIEKFKPPLVVIDALSGSHSGKENDTDSMKVIMKRLHILAQKYKIAIIVIHHLNKAPFGVPIYPITIDRLRGSTSISQLCRSILALTTPDPAQPEARRLDVIKLNLAKKPPAVGYVLTDEGPAWGNAPEPPKERRAADDAADFLRDVLRNGKREAGEITEEAKARGISDFALRGGRELLNVKVEKAKGIKNAPWTWELPNMEANQ